MQQFNYLILVILCGLLLSCSGSNGGSETEVVDDVGECSIPEQNRIVHEILLDFYLWYKDVPSSLLPLDYSDFDSPAQLLDFLKFQKLDRFSRIDDATEFNNFINLGKTIKFGAAFLTGTDNTLWVRYVFDDSAAGRAGLERSDQILSINNQTIEQLFSTIQWQDIFGPDVEGYPLDMQVLKKNGDLISIHMEKTVVNINTVLHHSIIQNGNEKVGYLVFHSFLATSKAELVDVFNDFKAAGVTKMILDLRYNGGGLVDVAQSLASAMVTTNTATDLFTVLKYNDKHQDLNNEFFFLSLENELDLEQVTLITTGATASASESVINGLKPFVDVKTVGSTTFGKPVGMNGFEFCGNVMLPITFAGFNQDGEGDFFDGISADCAAEDDLGFSFGDVKGPMLSEALAVSQSGSCSSAKAAQKISSAQRSTASYSLQDIIGVY